MKLLQLRLENINSIRQPVSLDFENGPLSEASLFAITGPTGAGKTTLLDALSVALYHKTPRLDGRDSKNPENLLSQGAREGMAEVEFAANGQRYLAEWKVKRGARSQKVSSSVKLLNMNTNQVLNEKKNQNPVPEILGLDFDAFRRAVLLAQGEFAAFLKANVEEKRALLESTTGMGLYDKLREILNQQVNAVRSDFAAVTAGLAALPTTDPEQFHTFESRLVESEKELEKHKNNGDKLAVELDHEKQRQRNWQKLSDLNGQLLQLQEQEQEYGNLQNEIKLADQARQIEPEHQAFLDYQQQAADITTEVAVADSDYQEKNAVEIEKQQQLEKSETELKSSTATARTQQKQLDAASRQEVELHGLAQQRDRLLEEDATLQAGAKIAAVEIKECQTKRKKRVAGIEQVNVFFADNPLPDNRNQVMVALNGFFSDWKHKTAQLQKIEDQGKQQKAYQDGLKAQQADITKKLNHTRQQLTTETGRLEALIKGRADLPELAAITAELPQYRQLEPAVRDFEKNEKTNSDKKNLAGEIEKALEDLHQNLVKTKALHDQHDSAVKVLQERLARLEAEKKAAGLEQLVAEIRREHLSDGAPCPVCGSSEHPWAEKDDMKLLAGIDAIHEKIALTETELTVIQKAIQSNKTTLTRLETEITGKDQALAVVQNDSEQIVKIQRQLKAEWEKVLPNQPINLAWLKDKIKKLETAEQEIHSLDRQVNVVDKKQSEIKQQEVVLSKDSEIFTADVQKVDAELVKLRDEYQQENTVCQEFAHKITGQLPQNYHALKIENAVREFEKLLNTAETKENTRKEWQSQIQALQVEITEKQRSYDADQQRLDKVKSRREELDKQIQLLEQEILAKTNGQSVADARMQLERELQLLEDNLVAARKAHQQAETQKTQALTTLDEKKRRLKKVNQTKKTKEDVFRAVLLEADFMTPESQKKALRPADWLILQEKRLKKFQQDKNLVQLQQEGLQTGFDKKPFDETCLQKVQTEHDAVIQAIRALNIERGRVQSELEQMRENRQKYSEQLAKRQKSELEKERWEKLESLIGRNQLRDFALQAMFEQLIRFANQQLRNLTNRYQLRVVDMKDMVIIDTWNANEERPVETLSGGETFLTSLSLALALSELSKGRAQLEALFLDEGFGTLDSATLEVALDALESLRLTGRTVGVISHVNEMTRRIPVRIEVRKRGNGSSTVSVTGG